ncbi:JAB1/MPN/MOV34 metalloenzyme domain [Dillenia turbinata]|uniref:JAB1/MPN/MOV34 metalloenzyme domain n=1 Tax=Dillenia turbinata TaxID=194707 RepID=A0AAN8UYD4_9MAGN
MRSSGNGRINIAASAQRLEVDNRISLRFYYRIADNILKQGIPTYGTINHDYSYINSCFYGRQYSNCHDLDTLPNQMEKFNLKIIEESSQVNMFSRVIEEESPLADEADIFRAERNIVDLYVMLLRFSSLTTETIPHHQDYKQLPQSQRNYLKKKLLTALTELEELKPVVQQKVDELNRKRWTNHNQNASFGSSLEWPLVRNRIPTNSVITKSTIQEFSFRGSRNQQVSLSRPVDEHFRRMSISFPPPKEETLSRHSILGPNGLRGQWQPPIGDKGIQYPSNLDLTPVEIPSFSQHVEDGFKCIRDNSSSDSGKLSSEPVARPDDDTNVLQPEEPRPMISFDATENSVPDIIRQPSPPPVLAEVQDLMVEQSNQVSEPECKMENASLDSLVGSDAPLQLHISTSLMESFMKLAKSNTDKNLETCGVLAGLLKNRKFYVTALIIPKQESTSDQCQTTNEEEIFEAQDKRSLFPLGWIHTHPTQSCFMSSIDVHTHYSYQIMLPEAIAIVMAPRDTSRKHGIFRLTTPGGMSVIRHCHRRGFHPHDPPADGSPIYKQCTDVYMSSSLTFDIIDLRQSESGLSDPHKRRRNNDRLVLSLRLEGPLSCAVCWLKLPPCLLTVPPPTDGS